MLTPEEELLVTEKNYVDSLQFLVNSYLIPMEKWLLILQESFDKSDDTILSSYLLDRQLPLGQTRKNSGQVSGIIDGLFKNIQQILHFHEFILKELNETQGDRVKIVKKMSYFDRGLLFYTDYIRNTENSRNLLNILKEDIRFRAFLYAIELNPASNGLSFEAQLAKPWQRVMKYTLLLKEIYKRTSLEAEQQLVQKTIHQLEKTIEDLNKGQEDADLLRLGKERAKYYDIILFGPARRYLFDSKVKIITHNSKLQQFAILCSDVLFLGKTKSLFSAATFVEYDLRTIVIIRYPPQRQSKYFIMRLSADQVIQVEVESVQLCEKWLSKFHSILRSSDKFIHLQSRGFSSSLRKVVVWEIVNNVKTERTLGRYLLPKNTYGGQIIDHSELQAYDEFSAIPNDDDQDVVHHQNDSKTIPTTTMSSVDQNDTTTASVIDNNAKENVVLADDDKNDFDKDDGNKVAEILDSDEDVDDNSTDLTSDTSSVRVPSLQRNYSQPENPVDDDMDQNTIGKFVLIDGVFKINERYRKEILGAQLPPSYSEQPLVTLCSTDDVELAIEVQSEATGYLLQLSTSSIEAMNFFQDISYCNELGLLETELPTNLDSIMNLFDQLDIPLGCLNKIKMLKDYHIQFLVDDSNFMRTPSNYPVQMGHEKILTRANKEANVLTYWQYCESLLHHFIDILSYVPTKSVSVSFVNSRRKKNYVDRKAKINNPKHFRHKFHEKIQTLFSKVNLRSRALLYEAVDMALKASQNQSDPTILIILSSGVVTDRPVEDVKTLISKRVSPQHQPVIFLPIGKVTNHEWMRGIDHQAEYVAEIKEYEFEKHEVAESQGPIFPYTRGIWLISQLASAINPSDLDLLDEGYPLTKYSLDLLLGRIHTPQEYQHYFINYPLCHHYVTTYPHLLQDQIGEKMNPVDSTPFPDDQDIQKHIQPLTNLAWDTMPRIAQDFPEGEK